MRRQDKPRRDPRTLAQQLQPMSGEVVCDLCGDGTSDPHVSGRWVTCRPCTDRLRTLDKKVKESK